jgi:hypothetical protein
MNTPHLSRYPVPVNSFGSRWDDISTVALDDYDETPESGRPHEWVENHPVSTFAVAVAASVTGGAAWVTFFLWFFHQWRDVLIVVPVVLATAAFTLFRWLFHRLH